MGDTIHEKILIAGVGNPLRQDDAFGIEVVKVLQNENLSDKIVIQEVGIGGIHLVQELHSGYKVLMLIDAVDWELEPGDISLRVVDSVKHVEDLPKAEKRDFLADMHYTNPVRAMILAKSLGVLPDEVYLLGCQAKLTEDFAIGMSDEVTAAVPKAAELVKEWVVNYLGKNKN